MMNKTILADRSSQLETARDLHGLEALEPRTFFSYYPAAPDAPTPPAPMIAPIEHVRATQPALQISSITFVSVDFSSGIQQRTDVHILSLNQSARTEADAQGADTREPRFDFTHAPMPDFGRRFIGFIDHSVGIRIVWPMPADFAVSFPQPPIGTPASPDPSPSPSPNAPVTAPKVDDSASPVHPVKVQANPPTNQSASVTTSVTTVATRAGAVMAPAISVASLGLSSAALQLASDSATPLAQTAIAPTAHVQSTLVDALGSFGFSQSMRLIPLNDAPALNGDSAVAPPASAAGAVERLASLVVPAKVFDFARLGDPLVLLNDPIAAFAEESASVSSTAAAIVASAQASGAWTTTFTVLAADVLLLTWLNRKRSKPRRRSAYDSEESGFQNVPGQILRSTSG